MAKEDNRDTLIGEENRRSPFAAIEKMAMVLSLVAIPIVVAVVGGRIEAEVGKRHTDRTLDKDYTQIALGVLATAPREGGGEADKALRRWAVETLNLHSHVKIAGEAQELLITGAFVLPEATLPPSAALPVSSPPSATPVSDAFFVGEGWVYFGKYIEGKWVDSPIEGLRGGVPEVGRLYRAATGLYVREDHPNPKLASIINAALKGVWLKVDHPPWRNAQTGSVWCHIKVINERFRDDQPPIEGGT